jgi:hypothetical protein
LPGSRHPSHDIRNSPRPAPAVAHISIRLFGRADARVTKRDKPLLTPSVTRTLEEGSAKPGKPLMRSCPHGAPTHHGLHADLDGDLVVVGAAWNWDTVGRYAAMCLYDSLGELLDDREYRYQG